MNDIIYLDNNATTRVADEAREAMAPFFNELYGNPSSVHTFGGQIRKYLEKARGQTAALLGVESSEILFTSGATESNNLAILGTLEAYPKKRHIITSQVEHAAVRNPIARLEGLGYSVTWLSVDEQGRMNLDELRAALQDDTALVSLIWANNETGTLFPIEEAAAIVRERGAIVHVDAVQAAGKVAVNLKDSGVQLLSISGHKFHGPKGVGALYVKTGDEAAPHDSWRASGTRPPRGDGKRGLDRRTGGGRGIGSFSSSGI